MSVLIKYEASHDRKIYYECNSCCMCDIESEVKVCPNCGARITKIADETYITHNHNDALHAYWKDTDNKKLRNEAIKWGLKRMAFEASL